VFIIRAEKLQPPYNTEPAAPRKPMIAIKNNPLRILLVDDDESNRYVEAVSLRFVGGFEVTEAVSGKDALGKINSESFDLIILDVCMSPMDGIATFMKLRLLAHGSAVPVIFLTGRTARRDLSKLCVLNAIGVLAKPFDPINLPVQIQSLLDSEKQRRISSTRHSSVHTDAPTSTIRENTSATPRCGSTV
jgi:two-component system OmpR family response regulator